MPPPRREGGREEGEGGREGGVGEEDTSSYETQHPRLVKVGKGVEI